MRSKKMKPESKERTEKWAAAKQPGQGLPRNIPHPWRGPLNGCSEGRQNLLQSTDCCMPPAPPLSNGSIYQPVTSHHCTLHMRDTNHLSISFINLWIKKSNIKKKKSNTDYYASSPGKTTHPHHIPASLKRSWTSNELWLDGTLRGGSLLGGDVCVFYQWGRLGWLSGDQKNGAVYQIFSAVSLAQAVLCFLALCSYAGHD